MERYFEWDDKKSESNFRKHGVRFDEAIWVFDDPLSLSVQDRIVDGEYRWQTIGMAGALLLMVAHTVRDEDDTEIVRVISARHVEPKERRRYERG